MHNPFYNIGVFFVFDFFNVEDGRRVNFSCILNSGNKFKKKTLHFYISNVPNMTCSIC